MVKKAPPEPPKKPSRYISGADARDKWERQQWTFEDDTASEGPMPAKTAKPKPNKPVQLNFLDMLDDGKPPTGPRSR